MCVFMGEADLRKLATLHFAIHEAPKITKRKPEELIDLSNRIGERMFYFTRTTTIGKANVDVFTGIVEGGIASVSSKPIEEEHPTVEDANAPYVVLGSPAEGLKKMCEELEAPYDPNKVRLNGS